MAAASAVDQVVAATPDVAPATHEPARVRLCTFRGHHGYSGMTVAIEASCGERSATCTIASPSMTGAVTDVDVRVELTPHADATCAERGTRVTSTCILPSTSTSSGPSGRYPTGRSRLAPRSAIAVRVNGDSVGALRTDAAGSPDPIEQCWAVEMK